MREKHVFLLYISSSSLKKRLTHVYGLTLMSLFIKIMMRNYETCPVITPKINFFRRGIYYLFIYLFICLLFIISLFILRDTILTIRRRIA